MATRFDSNTEQDNKVISGYEDEKSYDYVIPSCGLEDLDFAVFSLFDKQIPLYYDLEGETKKVPVVFATGERFALLRRKMPITDKRGALILPLISISRGAIENNPSKGIANNQMFPEVVARRVASNNAAWRQLNNFEGIQNLSYTSKESDLKNPNFSLKPDLENNIYETIEIPPVKYFGTTYEITVWSSFTQQMNKLLETIMSAYTLNPGQQFRVESQKGYWFPAFVESSFSQDTNYADYTDAHRYIKYSMTISTTGYILAPNIRGGKVGIKSLISAPKFSFEVLQSAKDIDPKIKGIPANTADARMLLEDVNSNDGFISQITGVTDIDNLQNLLEYDKSHAFVAEPGNLQKYDAVAEKYTNERKHTKVNVKDQDGNIVKVRAVQNTSGETVYDEKYAELIFNISNNDN
jgi:hypothetical protein